MKSNWKIALAAVSALLLGGPIPAHAQPLRALGIDVSAQQGYIEAANWARLKRATNQQVNETYGDGRDFVMIRASRGGTTGQDHRQGGYPYGDKFFSYSQRYDDPYYVQNITLATAAGLWAGSYHYARPDILASTLNSDGFTTAGVDNSPTDEADHFIQMAGPWLRPGYLVPTLDLEAGMDIRSNDALAQFCIDFSDRIYQVMGIRPAIYINGNYTANAIDQASASLRTKMVSAFPTLWNARFTNVDVQIGNPKDTYSGFYGPWDDPPNPAQPWKFWQYSKTGRINMYAGDIDLDVAHGGLEFLKDHLIPAVWMNNSDGQWTELLNWNSGQTPVEPVQGSGQLARVGELTLPAPRLPDTNDTVILDRPNVAVTINLDSGDNNIRKLYMRERLNITGGSLSINYVSSWDSTTFAAQFSGPVTLSGSGSLSVHTLQVDATRTLTLNGGSLAFNTLSLMPHSTTPARILMGGEVNFNSAAGATATIARGAGTGSSGWIDLAGRAPAFNVAEGVELVAAVPISNGSLRKTGLGTMWIEAENTCDTVIAAGTLALRGRGSFSSTASIIVSNQATLDVGWTDAAFTLGSGQKLSGNGLVDAGATLTAYGTISPGSPLGTLSFRTADFLILAGTTIMEVGRNGAALMNDAINCNGIVFYGGSLVVINIGPDPLADGDSFHLFPAGSEPGFSDITLPALGAGLQWDTSGLADTGRIKVVYVGLGQPEFQSVTRLGTNLILCGTNGIAAKPYYLLTSTNIDLPVASWTRVLTNDDYGAGGSFSNCIPMDGEIRFFRLQAGD